MSLTIRPRSTWTATPPAWPTFPTRLFTKSEVIFLAAHYPAIAAPVGVLDEAAEQAWLRTIRSWHVDGNGWADIGYALVVFQSGRAYMAGGITHSTAHAATQNRYAVGVLFMVGNTEPPSPAAVDTFNQIGPWLRDEHGFHALGVVTDHGRLPGQSTACAGPHIRAAIDRGILTLETKMARRYPTTQDFYALERDLAGRGWDITCGPGHVDRGHCAPGKHPHMKDSAHFRRGALDVSWPGPPISDIEALHAELLVEELQRDRRIDWRCVWNWGPGDHEDHVHVDDMKRHGWKDAVKPRPGVRARDGVDLFVSPRAFPAHVPPPNHGWSLAHMVTAQTLLGKMSDPATGVPLLRARADGYWGPLTQAASRAAQQILGLTVDGIPGPATVKAVQAHLERPAPPKPAPADPPPAPTPDPPSPEPVPGRVAGASAPATSGLVALQAPRRPKVYLAAPEDAPAAAGAGDGVVLVTRRGAADLPSALTTALTELAPRELVIVGGSTAIPESQARQARRAANL